MAARGSDAFAVLMPLAFGAVWGAAVARRVTGAVLTRKVTVRRVGIAVSGVVAALLLVALARPASTDPILDADGNVVEGSITDTIEVNDYLRDRFDEQAIYVEGSSWGTTLGDLAVQQRPDLYHAYIGTGQMVEQCETDTLMYAESLAYEWFEELKAPSKQLVVFYRSGHTRQRDEPGRFADYLDGVVLAETAA